MGSDESSSVVRGYRKLTAFDGTFVNATTGDSWFLDTRMQYGGQSVEILDRGSCELTITDSPGIALKDGCQKVEVNETFRSYVMYQFDWPNSVFMPLGYVEWFWSGTISRAKNSDPWPAKPDASAETNFSDMPFVESHLPVAWAGNVTTLKAQVVAKFGAMPEPPQIDWLDHSADARQMLIQFNGAPAAGFVDTLSATVLTPMGSLVNSPQGYLVWTTPDRAEPHSRWLE